MVARQAHAPRLTLLLAASAAAAVLSPLQAAPSRAGIRTSEISVEPAALISPEVNACAHTAYASMSLPQVIGQLFMVGLPGDRLTPELVQAISASHIGSVWFAARTTAGVTAVRTVTDAVQALATAPATARVRFFVAANQEGGLVQALAGPAFSTIPAAVVQGTLSPATLQARARTWGLQLRAAGVNLDFAPVADTVPPGTDARNAPIGALRREFGHDPASVRSHVVAFIRGMAAAGVATAVKHFPGLGRVSGNTDFVGGVRDGATTATDPYLVPFAAAVGAGVPSVMVSLATYTRIDPTHLAVFSRSIIGGMLRGSENFGGVVMSDALDAAAVSGMPLRSRAIDFVSAGGNMLVVASPSAAVAMASALATQAASDPWFHRLLDNAAVRVLRAKAAAGLVTCTA